MIEHTERIVPSKLPLMSYPPFPIASVTLAERLERALVLLAYFIELDGDIHLPLYEKLEAELGNVRRREETRSRARQLLSAHIRCPEGNALQKLELQLK